MRTWCYVKQLCLKTNNNRYSISLIISCGVVCCSIYIYIYGYISNTNGYSYISYGYSNVMYSSDHYAHKAYMLKYNTLLISYCITLSVFQIGFQTIRFVDLCIVTCIQFFFWSISFGRTLFYICLLYGRMSICVTFKDSEQEFPSPSICLNQNQVHGLSSIGTWPHANGFARYSSGSQPTQKLQFGNFY